RGIRHVHDHVHAGQLHELHRSPGPRLHGVHGVLLPRGPGRAGGDMSRYAAGFAPDYAASRQRFIEACTAHGVPLRHFPHPLKGPSGETLTVDVARFGPADARRVLIVSSGTHGIEGFCGAGIQHALITSGLVNELPPDTAVAFVHGVNPFGFAWMRRTDENNVDLNRNFLDHDAGVYPDDSIYNEVHALLLPEDWDGPGRQAAEE